LVVTESGWSDAKFGADATPAAAPHLVSLNAGYIGLDKVSRREYIIVLRTGLV
jgi:hypothetical protein